MADAMGESASHKPQARPLLAPMAKAKIVSVSVIAKCW
jgi:hypothetical protein